jgi:hypothetical protein
MRQTYGLMFDPIIPSFVIEHRPTVLNHSHCKVLLVFISNCGILPKLCCQNIAQINCVNFPEEQNLFSDVDRPELSELCRPAVLLDFFQLLVEFYNAFQLFNIGADGVPREWYGPDLADTVAVGISTRYFPGLLRANLDRV